MRTANTWCPRAARECPSLSCHAHVTASREVASRNGAIVRAPALRDALERAGDKPENISVVRKANAMKFARLALNARARVHTKHAQ